MRKSLKKNVLKILSGTLVFVTMMTSPAFAGQWAQDGNNWKYQNDDGTYAVNWQWIDGKSYCFDSNGIMYANTTTPDGYTVNENGEWTVNGVVQTQNTASISNNESQGLNHLKSWLVVEPMNNPAVWFGHVDTTLEIQWITGNDYLMNHPDITNGATEEEYRIRKAVNERNPRYLEQPADFLVLAELAGFERTGRSEYYSLKGEQIDALKKEVNNFLDSFPNWRTASDYEKAVRICERIHKADYDTSMDDSYYSYGCLVNGKASCQGYTNAAFLLAWAIDLPISGLGSINHTYPVFLIDGMWLANEPTTKDTFFTVADVYQKVPFYEEYGLNPYQLLGKYCEGVGYEIPTDASRLNQYGHVRERFGTFAVSFH